MLIFSLSFIISALKFLLFFLCFLFFFLFFVFSETTDGTQFDLLLNLVGGMLVKDEGKVSKVQPQLEERAGAQG